MNTDRPIGRVGVQAIDALADMAAERIRRAKRPRAVCVSPEGQVTIELAADVVPEDMAGVYTPDTDRLELWRRIAEDMHALVAERPVVLKQRRHVFSGRARKEAA